MLYKLSIFCILYVNKKDDETNVINNNGIMIVLILVQVFAYTKYNNCNNRTIVN